MTYVIGSLVRSPERPRGERAGGGARLALAAARAAAAPAGRVQDLPGERTLYRQIYLPIPL